MSDPGVDPFDEIGEPEGPRPELQHDLTLVGARQDQRQLMRMVSHEFRTPLAAIRYASDMLTLMLERPQQAVAQRLKSIDEAVSRMTMLIDRFLASERQDEGVLKIEQVDFSALCEDVQRHFDHAGLGERLRLHPVAPMPAYRGDTEMLRTVLVNLVDNALKYGRDGTDVTIRIEEASPPPGQRGYFPAGAIRVSVIDRGEGIPAEHLPRLTERFYRVDTARSRQLGGTGLGLAIVKHIVNRHRGAMSVDSRAGEGSVFSVFLARPDEMDQREAS